MDQDEFWALIEQSRRHSPDPDDRLGWLEDQLVRRPLDDIADFQIRQDDGWNFDDPAQVARHLPRLSALFPVSSRDR